MVGLVIVISGCTSPNPRSCSDGACTDPALPFCDVDGAIGGTAETCIAVTCTPNEHASCRGDIDVRCNATGTNFDLVECSLDCNDALGGCTTCTTNEQCSNPAPVCEVTSQTCRGCRTDDECDSEVCDLDAGRCLPISEVVYASPAGGPSAPCTKDMRCSLTQAVGLAVANPLRSTIRLASGSYTTPIRTTTGTLTIVGPGATLQGPVSSIARGSIVTIRGVRLDLTGGQLLCGGDGTSTATMLGGTLHLRDLEVYANGNAWYLVGCTGTVRRVTVAGTAAGPPPIIILQANSSLDADGLRVNGLATYPVSLRAETQSTVTVVNSVFDNSRISANTSNQITVSYSTLAVNDGYPALVTAAGNTINMANNILVTSAGSAVDCSGCLVNHNILFPQGPGSGTNTIADPQFVAPATGDYHLRATSPAVNAAMSSASPANDHDHEGVARPQGAAPDIGAFERTP